MSAPVQIPVVTLPNRRHDTASLVKALQDYEAARSNVARTLVLYSAAKLEHPDAPDRDHARQDFLAAANALHDIVKDLFDRAEIDLAAASNDLRAIYDLVGIPERDRIRATLTQTKSARERRQQN